jgi:RNA polymerase sigma-70 factor (ECF subfamily)
MQSHDPASTLSAGVAATVAGSAVTNAPDTLEAFVAVHYRRLVRLAGLVALDAAEAQDAVQNALIRAWRSHHRLRDRNRMKSWLDAIVVREAIRLNGRRRSWLRGLVRGGDIELPAKGLPTGASLDLAAGLAALPAPQRAAVALHYEAGYSVAEVAQLLDIPLETVRSRLRLARQRLRRELSEETT